MRQDERWKDWDEILKHIRQRRTLATEIREKLASKDAGSCRDIHVAEER